MNKYLAILAIAATLTACGKTQETSAPASSSAPAAEVKTKDQAYQEFFNRKATHVRTLAEIEADEKAKGSSHAKQ